MSRAANFLEVMEHWSKAKPDQMAVGFLPEGEIGPAEQVLSYAQLHQRAMALAAQIAAVSKEGDRVLLLQPAGLDFVASFFACIYSGRVAVAAYPPRNQRHIPRIEGILADAGAGVIVLTKDALPKIGAWLGDRVAKFKVIVSDGSAGPLGEWRRPVLRPEQLALLQYSSGSTGTPRGVMITHENIMVNAAMIRRSFGYHEGSHFVSWLPIYHDMGLIGNLLQPIYLGTSTVLMPPTAFLQKPWRWLAAISHYRASTTGAPNFAFDLAARVITAEQKAALDLSCLELVYNGSEPIDPRALDRFAAAFAGCGLRRTALHACYGMAETTLLATCGRPGQGPGVLRVDPAALAQDRAVVLEGEAAAGTAVVSCGFSVEGQELSIVHPESLVPRAEGEVGEIWLKGGHVSPGYWGQEEVSARTMHARRADGSGPWLRTGDLGFMRSGELYVTGRIKDVVILRGKNHYPHDIERTAEASHPALQPGACAAFAVKVDGIEQLGIAAEVKRTALRGLDGAAVVSAIRRMVFEEHELQVHAITLLMPATLPKTSSGKLQRFAARAGWEQGTLEVVHADPQAAVAAAGAPAVAIPRLGGDPEASRRKADEIIEWLRGYAEQRVNSHLIDERRCIPPYIVLDFGLQGLLGLEVPVALGGSGLTCQDALRVAVQLGGIDVNLSSFVGVHNALGLRTLLRHGSERMRREVIPRIAEGRELIAFAFTEDGAGSNPRAISSRATPDGAGGWRLHGSKRWIGTGAWSTWFVASAHLLDESGRDRGITTFLLRQGAPGLRMGTEELTMGMRGMIQNTVHLEGVRVGPEDIVGQPGAGMEVAQDTMKFGRLFIATVSLGTMQRCVQLMLRYALRRPMSSGLLVENIVTRDRLSGHLVRIAALRSFIRQFAGWYDAGVDVPEEFFALVKSAGPESLGWAVDDLLQMLGGRGYIETNLVPQLFRDARLVRIFEGPTETMIMFLGSRLASQSRPLQEFLRERLNAPAIADLVQAAAEIAKRHHLVGGSEGEQAAGVQRVSKLLGEFGLWALWLAVVENDADGTDAELQRARAWLAAKMQARHAALSRPMPAHEIPLGTAEILAAAARHRLAIGDVEQQAAGVEYDLDPLLRRGDVAPAPRPEPAVAGQSAAKPVGAAESRTPAALGAKPADIEAWLCAWIGQRLSLPADRIDPTRPFSDFGIDSLTAVELSAGLGAWLQRELPTTLVWDYPSVRNLAANVAPGTGAAAVAAAQAPVKAADTSAGLAGLSGQELASLLAQELESMRGGTRRA